MDSNPFYDEDFLMLEAEPITLQMLILLCKQYPNDTELGKIIRNLVKTLK